MRITHTMYRVLDIDRSVEWYSTVFGWKVVRQTQLPSALNTFMGPDDKSDILELTMNYGRTEPYAMGEAYGHIAVEVGDLDVFLARLEPLGIVPEKPPFAVRENGPRLCFVRDPDNYRIELTETRHLVPVVIPMAEAPVTERDATPLRMKLARTITHAGHGSALMAGVSWMQPGEKSSVWSTEEEPPDPADGIHYVGPVHEIFFLIAGQLRIGWSGGELDMGPNDTLYLPPGHRFWAENPGPEPAFLFYNETPPLG